ncbi:nuclease S1, partial [Colletotrichum higginsianum]
HGHRLGRVPRRRPLLGPGPQPRGPGGHGAVVGRREQQVRVHRRAARGPRGGRGPRHQRRLHDQRAADGEHAGRQAGLQAGQVAGCHRCRGGI